LPDQVVGLIIQSGEKLKFEEKQRRG